MKPAISRLAVASLLAAAVLAPLRVQAAVSQQVEEKILAAAPEKATAKPAKPRKVLVYTQALGFYHGSIPLAARAIELLGKKTGAYEATVTDDPAVFAPETLKQYDAVFQDQCTGDMLSPKEHATLRKEMDGLRNKLNDKKKPPTPEDAEALKKKIEELNKKMSDLPPAKPMEDKYKQALLDFVNGGKGLIGCHAATDCYYGWKEYGDLIGGYFTGHPYSAIVVRNDDPENPVNAAFEKKGFSITDEIYVFGPRNPQPYSREKQRVLLSIDVPATQAKDAKFDPKAGKREDADYAISWIKAQGQGRVFYCSFGHQDHVWTNPAVLRHYLDGIQWALGDLKADATPKPLAAEK
jgi:type 1 glutamine amidotransferase